MKDPVSDVGELNEGEKGGGEFFLASANAAATFESAEEVFDSVAVAIVAEPTEYLRFLGRERR